MTTWRSKIPAVKKRTSKELSALVRTSAFRIEQQAKTAAPVDTGMLRNSIHTQILDETTAMVAVGAEYGVYVEFGTRYQAAQPYFIPAVEQVVHSFGGELKKIL